jgi:hypothetical protein
MVSQPTISPAPYHCCVQYLRSMANRPQFVVVASPQVVYVWQYKLPAPPKQFGASASAAGAASASSALTSAGAAADAAKKKEGIERVFHIDDPPSSATDPRLKQRRMDTITSGMRCGTMHHADLGMG